MGMMVPVVMMAMPMIMSMVMFMIMLMTELQYVAFMNVWKGGPIPIMVDVLAGTVLGTLAGGAAGLVLWLMHKQAAE